MQILTAPLNQPTTGDCSGCHAKSVTLVSIAVRMESNPKHKYATGEPIPEAETAFLVCDNCARNNPICKLEPHRLKDIEPHSEEQPDQQERVTT